jgi:hypothetical protein
MCTQISTGVRDDLFESLKYDKPNCKKGQVSGRYLSRHFVFEWQFRTSWEKICAGLTTVDWSKPQTAKSLYNYPGWNSMKFGMRIAIGRCLRFFVNQGMLPLRVINPNATGTKRYLPINL